MPAAHDAEPAFYTSAMLGDRWGTSAAWVRELTKRGSTTAVSTPLAEGTVIGPGRGTYTWTPAQVAAFEAANPGWCSEGAIAARRVSDRGRKRTPPDDADA